MKPVLPWVLVAVAAASATGRAEGPRELLGMAESLFEGREDRRALERAIETCERALDGDDIPDRDLRVRVLLALSKYHFTLGEYHAADRGSRAREFAKGMKRAGEALGLEPLSAGAHFWRAANLWRWGEAHPFRFRLRRREFESDLRAAIQLDRPYERWGADRILAAYYLSAGSGRRGVEEAAGRIETAAANAPGLLWNLEVQADAYEALGQASKAAEIRAGIVFFDLDREPGSRLENSRVQARVGASMEWKAPERGTGGPD